METVLGLFEHYEDARRTVSNLREVGLSEDGLSLLSRDDILGDVNLLDSFDRETSGFMKKVSASAIDFLGALASLVISDQKAESYTKSLVRGGALVVARATNRDANLVNKIMRRYHALEVQHILSGIKGQPPDESEEIEPYFPLLWHRLQEA